jgi:hypothetical protein
VASASEPGRIFCNALEVNGTMETVITGTLVREPNYFAIVTSGGITVSITVGGLLPMTEYEAWHGMAMMKRDFLYFLRSFFLRS